MRVVIVSCMELGELARDELTNIRGINLVGVVNLDPALKESKCLYNYIHYKNTHDTKDINSVDTIKWLKEQKPDVILQTGWSQIFEEEVLNIPNLFCVGIHGSPLPEGRGAAVHNWKIIEGGGEWGNTMFIMESKTDVGDILDFMPFTIEPKDDINDVYHEYMVTTGIMIERTFPKLRDGDYTRTPQDVSKATRYYSRRPEDGRMEFDWPAEKCDRYIRALTKPYPGAFFQMGDKKLIIWKASVE